MAQESILQTKIKKDLEKEGWLVNKMMLVSLAGWPDIEAFKDKRIIFMEIKAEGKKARPLQEYRHKQLRDQGFEVYVIDSWNVYLSIKQTRLI